jgi:hypothetical protein
MMLEEQERRLVDALGQASSLQLYRLQAILRRMLTDPKRVIEIRRQLHLGQTVRYFDLESDQMRAARVVEMKDKEILVQDQATLRHWRLAYAAVEPPASGQADVADSTAATTLPPAPKPGREDFQRGQKVAFEDKHLRTQVGVITRINQRTASIDTGDGLVWKVSFGLLRHVVDV